MTPDAHPEPTSLAPAGGWLPAAATAAPLPEETDVLIVGGGLAGAALAWFLAREGVEVTLVERGELNREASGTNAGSFHFQVALHQLTAMDTSDIHDKLLTEVRLHVEAAEVWKELERELDGPLDIHVTGGLMAAETDEELRLLYDKQVIERDAGLEVHVLTGQELRDFAPYLGPTIVGATYCPQEGHANPALATPLFALRATQKGAQIRTHAGVTGIAVDQDAGAGRFTVDTARGRIRASRLVNAAGAWAKPLGEMVGLDPPLRASGLHINVTEAREAVLGPMVQHIGRRLTLKQSANGSFIIGGGWPSRPEPVGRYSTMWESMAGNTAVAIDVVPLLRDVRIVRTWSGVMAFTHDLAPMVGESRRVPGYHSLMATTGFTLSPLMARLLAESMTTGRAVLPPSYDVDRVVAPPIT
jgi:glycine/D-amino acid oxidase-like deaminating enzyme